MGADKENLNDSAHRTARIVESSTIKHSHHPTATAHQSEMTGPSQAMQRLMDRSLSISSKAAPKLNQSTAFITPPGGGEAGTPVLSSRSLAPEIDVWLHSAAAAAARAGPPGALSNHSPSRARTQGRTAAAACPLRPSAWRVRPASLSGFPVGITTNQRLSRNKLLAKHLIRRGTIVALAVNCQHYRYVGLEDT
jgi:hypothetical protein